MTCAKTLPAAVLGLSLFALTACGSPTETAADTASSAPAAAGSSTSAGFPLTLTHAMGETTIESQPQRVVALDPSYVDAALLLDAELVGYAEYRQNPEDPFADYLGDVSEETAEAVNDPQYVAPSAEEKTGLVNKWPFDAEKKDYLYWDSMLGEAVDATYDGTETIEGLETYKYHVLVEE